jgi:Tol biopolymer transport system component
VYAPAGSGSYDSPIEWLDRSGKSSVLRSAPSDWANLRFAPDGRRIAISIWDGKQWDVWVDDWARDALARLTTSNSHSRTPVWTPDGRRIAFASQRGEKAVANTFNLYWQRADGTGDAQRLTTSENQQFPGSWHKSGKVLAFEEQSSHFSVMLLPMDGDEASGWKPGTPTVFLSGALDVRAPAFSPDGAWLAYESSQSGQNDVYVRPFPGPGVPSQISTGGGVYPTWSRARHELLYSTFDRRVMVVNYSVEGESFHTEPPRPWPGARYTSRRLSSPIRFRDYDLNPDGNRLALAPVGETEPAMKWDRLEIILNFSDELRRIAPVQRH